jgi:tetratricopeptide (TPR) repeat protein
MASLRSRRNDQAIEHLNTLRNKFPDSDKIGDAYQLLMYVSEQKGDADGAFTLASEFVKKNPENTEAHFLFAAFASKKGERLDDAMKSIDTVMRLEKPEPRHLMVKADIFSAMDKKPEAKALLDKALKEATNDQEKALFEHMLKELDK